MNKIGIINSIAVLFILLFFYTGISKFFDYATFYQQLSQSPLLKPWAGCIVWVNPTLEILIGIIKKYLI